MKNIAILPLVLIAALLAGGASRIVQDQCGPFTDVTPGFCPYVLELYYLGITAGTSATTFSPDDPLTRGQGAVFIAKGLNQALARSSRRAALGQWWTTTPHWDLGLGVTNLGQFGTAPAADGADVWAPSDSSVYRVRSSDGKLLDTWSGTANATAVLAAMGRIFVVGELPNNLYMIDPTAPAGAAPVVAANIAEQGPESIAFDGSRIWTANCCLQGIPPLPPGSISIITPGTWDVQTITTGFDAPTTVVFDGTSMWVVDLTALKRADSSGAVTQTIPMSPAGNAVFDGANIWLPTSAGLTVVRASTGEIVANLAPQTLTNASAEGGIGFDGRRILLASPSRLMLWDAQSLAPLGSVETGYDYVSGICSDGINFWLTLQNFSPDSSVLARF
jgi:hypothetical protein